MEDDDHNVVLTQDECMEVCTLLRDPCEATLTLTDAPFESSHHIQEHVSVDIANPELDANVGATDLLARVATLLQDINWQFCTTSRVVVCTGTRFARSSEE